MVIDKLENIARYAGLSPQFAAACRYLAGIGRLDTLPMGKVDIDGEQVFGNAAENLLTSTVPAFEQHDRYADLQLVLTGQERFVLGVHNVAEPAAPGSDFRKATADSWVDFTLEAGQFVIFFPGEAHAPGLAVDSGALVRKLVLKVACD